MTLEEAGDVEGFREICGGRGLVGKGDGGLSSIYISEVGRPMIETGKLEEGRRVCRVCRVEARRRVRRVQWARAMVLAVLFSVLRLLVCWAIYALLSCRARSQSLAPASCRGCNPNGSLDGGYAPMLSGLPNRCFPARNLWMIRRMALCRERRYRIRT